MPTPQGFLTESDREFLRGKTEFEGENADQQRVQKRYRLRKRIRQSFIDFQDLFAMLSDDDRNLIFDDLREDEELLNGITAMLAFTYWVTELDQGVDFERLLEQGVAAAEQFPRTPTDYTVPSKVDASIEVTRTRDMHSGRVKEILKMGPEKAREEGLYITPHELGQAIMTANIGGYDDEMFELIKDYLDEENDVNSSMGTSVEQGASDMDFGRWSSLSMEAMLANLDRKMNERENAEDED